MKAMTLHKRARKAFNDSIMDSARNGGQGDAVEVMAKAIGEAVAAETEGCAPITARLIKEEREGCAKISECHDPQQDSTEPEFYAGAEAAGKEIAAAIRARGEVNNA